MIAKKYFVPEQNNLNLASGVQKPTHFHRHLLNGICLACISQFLRSEEDFSSKIG